MQSHRGFSPWVDRQANGVSVPHCPTATTRRSPAAARAGRVGESSGAPTTAAVAVPARFKNARRSRDPAMMTRPPARECARMVTSARRACQRRQPARRLSILVPPMDTETTDIVTSRRRAPLALGLFAVLATAAALRLWRLDQNGFGNEYYTAGVRSMSQSWHNFLYNAFDPAGFISVDKPPVALWIQVASVKLFGFHALSVLVPQALEGVAAVVLLYHLVERRFGAAAGLLAALFLALTPVSVAIDRSSNTDSCLVLVLLLAAWALTLAADRGSRALLVLAKMLVGLGFNVKMLAAFVVLPTFALVYFVGVPLVWRRRVGHLAVAGVVLTVVSLSWVLAFDLTPPERRPYAGTTNKNSMLELAVGPYGVGRFIRSAEFRSASIAAASAPARGATRAGVVDRAPETGPRRGFARLFVRAPTGPLRLADGQL